MNSERASLHTVSNVPDAMLPTRSLLLNLQVFQKAGIQAAGLPQRDGTALSKGIAIVRKVLQDNKAQNQKGWKTHEIYNLALKEAAPQGFRTTVTTTPRQVALPHPEHPIRSKKCVVAFAVILFVAKHSLALQILEGHSRSYGRIQGH